MRDIAVEFGLSREELIAALVEDSIGYLSPLTAERHIQDWEMGVRRCACERCLWVFAGDLRKCLEGAARHWGYLPEARKEGLLKVVRAASQLDLATQVSVGLLWPTAV